MTDYLRDTASAYRSPSRAEEYQRYQTRAWTWGRVATMVEQWHLRRALRAFHWSSSDLILDVPCGTGILARSLNDLPCRIVACDISREMMALGRQEYRQDALTGAVQCDILRAPFRAGAFKAVFVIGFLHRIPMPLKQATLLEIARVTRSVVFLTCSIDSPVQRLKQSILRRFSATHAGAPAPARLEDVVAECRRVGLTVMKSIAVLPLLSSEFLLVLSKDESPQ